MKKVIKANEIPDYEGKTCPECSNGKLEQIVDHDAITGNSTKLKCSTEAVSCGFTIDIVKD